MTLKKLLTYFVLWNFVLQNTLSLCAYAGPLEGVETPFSSRSSLKRVGTFAVPVSKATYGGFESNLTFSFKTLPGRFVGLFDLTHSTRAETIPDPMAEKEALEKVDGLATHYAADTSMEASAELLAKRRAVLNTIQSLPQSLSEVSRTSGGIELLVANMAPTGEVLSKVVKEYRSFVGGEESLETPFMGNSPLRFVPHERGIFMSLGESLSFLIRPDDQIEVLKLNSSMPVRIESPWPLVFHAEGGRVSSLHLKAPSIIHERLPLPGDKYEAVITDALGVWRSSTTLSGFSEFSLWGGYFKNEGTLEFYGKSASINTNGFHNKRAIIGEDIGQGSGLTVRTPVYSNEGTLEMDTLRVVAQKDFSHTGKTTVKGDYHLTIDGSGVHSGETTSMGSLRLNTKGTFHNEGILVGKDKVEIEGKSVHHDDKGVIASSKRVSIKGDETRVLGRFSGMQGDTVDLSQDVPVLKLFLSENAQYDTKQLRARDRLHLVLNHDRNFDDDIETPGALEIEVLGKEKQLLLSSTLIAPRGIRIRGPHILNIGGDDGRRGKFITNALKIEGDQVHYRRGDVEQVASMTLKTTNFDVWDDLTVGQLAVQSKRVIVHKKEDDTLPTISTTRKAGEGDAPLKEREVSLSLDAEELHLKDGQIVSAGPMRLNQRGDREFMEPSLLQSLGDLEVSTVGPLSLSKPLKMKGALTLRSKSTLRVGAPGVLIDLWSLEGALTLDAKFLDLQWTRVFSEQDMRLYSLEDILIGTSLETAVETGEFLGNRSQYTKYPFYEPNGAFVVTNGNLHLRFKERTLLNTGEVSCKRDLFLVEDGEAFINKAGILKVGGNMYSRLHTITSTCYPLSVACYPDDSYWRNYRNRKKAFAGSRAARIRIDGDLVLLERAEISLNSSPLNIGGAIKEDHTILISRVFEILDKEYEAGGPGNESFWELLTPDQKKNLFDNRTFFINHFRNGEAFQPSLQLFMDNFSACFGRVLEEEKRKTPYTLHQKTESLWHLSNEYVFSNGNLWQQPQGELSDKGTLYLGADCTLALDHYESIGALIESEGVLTIHTRDYMGVRANHFERPAEIRLISLGDCMSHSALFERSLRTTGPLLVPLIPLKVKETFSFNPSIVVYDEGVPMRERVRPLLSMEALDYALSFMERTPEEKALGSFSLLERWNQNTLDYVAHNPTLLITEDSPLLLEDGSVETQSHQLIRRDQATALVNPTKIQTDKPMLVGFVKMIDGHPTLVPHVVRKVERAQTGIVAKELILTGEGSLEVEGGVFLAKGALSLEFAGDINLSSLVSHRRFEAAAGTIVEESMITSPLLLGSRDSTTTVVSQGDINLAAIQTASKGRTLFQASGNFTDRVIHETLTTIEKTSSKKGSREVTTSAARAVPSGHRNEEGIGVMANGVVALEASRYEAPTLEFGGRKGLLALEAHHTYQQTVVESKKEKGVFGTKKSQMSAASSHTTALGIDLRANKVRMMGAPLHLTYPHIQAESVEIVTGGNPITLMPGTQESWSQMSRSQSDLIWSRQKTSMERHKTYVQPQLMIGTLKTDGGRFIVGTVRADTDNHVQALVPYGTLIEKVPLWEIHDSYSESHSTPGALTSILITSAITFAMPGVGTGLTATLTQAGFSAAASQVAIGTLSNGGDIGAGLRGVLSRDGLRNIGMAMATAGLMKHALPTLEDPLTRALMRSTGGGLVGTAFGRKFDIEDILGTGFVEGLGALGANMICDWYNKNPDYYWAHKASHFGLGALMGVALNSGDPAMAALAGGVSGVTAEMFAEMLFGGPRELATNPINPDSIRTEAFVSKMLGGIAGTLASQGEHPHIAFLTAHNAVENNVIKLLSRLWEARLLLGGAAGGAAVYTASEMGDGSGSELLEALGRGDSLIIGGVARAIDKAGKKGGGSGSKKSGSKDRAGSGDSKSGKGPTGSGGGPQGSDALKATAIAATAKHAVKEVGRKYKVRIPNISGKEGAKGVPDLVKSFKPCVGESGREATIRFFKTVFGRKPTEREWGPTGLANQAKKFYDRAFMDPK